MPLKDGSKRMIYKKKKGLKDLRQQLINRWDYVLAGCSVLMKMKIIKIVADVIVMIQRHTIEAV